MVTLFRIYLPTPCSRKEISRHLPAFLLTLQSSTHLGSTPLFSKCCVSIYDPAGPLPGAGSIAARTVDGNPCPRRADVPGRARDGKPVRCHLLCRKGVRETGDGSSKPRRGSGAALDAGRGTKGDHCCHPKVSCPSGTPGHVWGHLCLSQLGVRPALRGWGQGC